MGITLSTAARNAACDAIVDLLDVGSGTSHLKIKTSGDVILSEHNLSATAFSAAVAGVATANTIADDTSANDTGTAAKCVFNDQSGQIVFSGTCGAIGSGADLEMNSLSIAVGVKVSITASGTVTMPAS